MPKHMKYKKVIGNSQREFTKDTSLFTEVIALCDEMTGSSDKVKTAASVYPDYSKVFNAVSFIAKEIKHKLDKWTSK